MADVTFPSICPSSRSIRMAQFPIRSVKAASGATSLRVFGNAPSDTEMRVGFDNLPDSTIATIAETYNDSGGIIGEVTFPAQFWEGMDGVLKAELDRADLSWRFRDAPSITSVAPGISRLEVTFIGIRETV